MSNEDRKVSLAEVRDKIIEEFTGAHWSTGYAEGVADRVLARLTKPRLKPDCPIMYDHTTGESGLLMHARNIHQECTTIRPLIRADRVMEWAKRRLTPATIEAFGKFIREETEVQE